MPVRSAAASAAARCAPRGPRRPGRRQPSHPGDRQGHGRDALLVGVPRARAARGGSGCRTRGGFGVRRPAGPSPAGPPPSPSGRGGPRPRRPAPRAAGPPSRAAAAAAVAAKSAVTRRGPGRQGARRGRYGGLVRVLRVGEADPQCVQPYPAHVLGRAPQHRLGRPSPRSMRRRAGRPAAAACRAPAAAGLVLRPPSAVVIPPACRIHGAGSRNRAYRGQGDHNREGTNGHD